MIKKLVLILLILFSANNLYCQTDEWQILGDMPIPVAEGELVFYQLGMYLVGGYSENTQESTNLIQPYNVTENTWGNIVAMVESRKSFVSVAYSRELFSVGGASSGSSNANSIEVWNFFSPSEINTTNTHFNRQYSSGVLFGGQLFIVGGNPENIDPYINYPYIYKYDLSVEDSPVVEIENNYFANRKLPEQQMVEIFQDEIFIFGGVINGISQDIYKYDINDSTLVKLNIRLMEPRAGGKAIRLGEENFIFIIGGFNEDEDALSSVEIFSFSSNQYRIWSGPELNVARKNFMVNQYANVFYVMGGYDKYGNVISSIETMEPGTSNLENESYMPKEVYLKQNYPNPFNPQTEISFSINKTSEIIIDIYTIMGEHINRLANGEFSPGSYSFKWNGDDSNGRSVSSGVYLYTLNTGRNVYSKKMILLK